MNTIEFEPREVLLDKWLKALRSGEYKQAQGRLKTAAGYCCLGVLCEIAGLKDREYLDSSIEGERTFLYPGYDSSTVLPIALASHMKLKTPNAAFDISLLVHDNDVTIGEFTYATLTQMNDGRRDDNTGEIQPGSIRSFTQIADFIEQNPSIVFNP